jgi:hypothetical protein
MHKTCLKLLVWCLRLGCQHFHAQNHSNHTVYIIPATNNLHPIWEMSHIKVLNMEGWMYYSIFAFMLTIQIKHDVPNLYYVTNEIFREVVWLSWQWVHLRSQKLELRITT